MVKLGLTSHFHTKVRATRGLAHTSGQIATTMMVLYRSWANDLGAKWLLIETPTLRGFLRSDCSKRPENPHNFLIERPPGMEMIHIYECSDQSWNNSCESAAQFFYFPQKTGHQSWGISSYGEEPSTNKKTQQNQPKTPKNSCKPADFNHFCSLPEAETLSLLALIIIDVATGNIIHNTCDVADKIMIIIYIFLFISGFTPWEVVI